MRGRLSGQGSPCKGDRTSGDGGNDFIGAEAQPQRQ